MKEEHSILFVLVIYGCKIEDSISFNTLIACNNKVGDLFVYDNSPTMQYTDLFVAKYIHDTSNGGLGKAYNAAYKYANKHGYKWLLLLDQDTSFPMTALNSYYNAIATIKGVSMIVPRHQISNGMFLSPTHYRMRTSCLQQTTPTGFVHFADVAPINSGMLVSVESFKSVGGYDEKVWLDFSDICFIEKYKKKYSTYYVLPDVICIQKFSATEKDKKNIYKRFRVFLNCARNFPKHTIIDHISLIITTLRPTLSRTIRERTLIYLKAYWNIYVLKKHIK